MCKVKFAHKVFLSIQTSKQRRLRMKKKSKNKI